MKEVKQVVRVSKKHRQTEIKTTVRKCEEEIAAEMSLSDFLHVLSKEMGNPTTLLTINGLEKAMKKAAEVVISDMKKETVFVA